MKHIFAVLFFLTGSICLAQDVKFQNNSESAVQETVEQKDGKTVRTIRSGQVERQGQPRVGDIQDSEISSIERRRKALRMSSFGFGPFGSSAVGEDKVIYGFTYASHWETSTTGEVNLELLGSFNRHDTVWNFGLGYAWLPFTGEISPILGASLGMGFGTTNDDKYAGGFSGQISAGVRLFRLSDVQMEVLGRYLMIFDDPNPGVAGLLFRVLF